MPLDHSDKQGGKTFGAVKKQQADNMDSINQQFVTEDAYKDVEDLEEKLQSYKKTFMHYDVDNDGGLNIMDVKRMMEDIGQAKTHLELKKMIAEVDTTNTGAINYHDFVSMMLGPKSSVLKLILLFEEKKKEKEKPKGIAPKKSLSDLP